MFTWLIGLPTGSYTGSASTSIVDERTSGKSVPTLCVTLESRSLAYVLVLCTGGAVDEMSLVAANWLC